MRHTPHTMTFYNANYGDEVMQRIEQILEAVRKQDAAMILVTDLNLTLEESRYLYAEVNRLTASGKKLELQLLDHHGSGRDSADQFDWYLLDTKRCATKITYDYIKEQGWINDPEPRWLCRYVDVVNAIDLWLQDETSNFEYGKVLMRLVTETRELSRVIFPDDDRDYKLAMLRKAAEMVDVPNAPIRLDEQIHAMKKTYFKENVDDTLDNLATRFIVELMGKRRGEMTIYYKGYRGFMSYGVGNTSIIGNGFLVAHPEYDFIVDVSMRGTLSLRANNQVDVSLIAREWCGGGGHPNAAGGRISGFKEQYRYEKVKMQVESVIAQAESSSGVLNAKVEG